MQTQTHPGFTAEVTKHKIQHEITRQWSWISSISLLSNSWFSNWKFSRSFL